MESSKITVTTTIHAPVDKSLAVLYNLSRHNELKNDPNNLHKKHTAGKYAWVKPFLQSNKR